MSIWWCTYGGDWKHVRTIDEFGGTVANGFTCGPAANANLWSAMHRLTPTYDLVDQITSRDSKDGYFDKGQTITGVYDSFRYGWNWPSTQLVLDPYDAAGYGESAIFNACQRVQRTQNGGVLLETSAAYNLPFNEPGVQYHFVALLGYDAGAAMVFVANADREPLPRGSGTPDWYPVGQLLASRPVGILTVLGGNMAGVPAGWSDNGTVLSGPNGVPVIAGFRTYVMSRSWDATDIPLAPETTNVSPLEYNHPALGSGSLQYFLKSTLEWRQSDNTVYPMYQGRELMTLRAMIASAQSALRSTYHGT